jgi:hypothetical protein
MILALILACTLTWGGPWQCNLKRTAHGNGQKGMCWAQQASHPDLFSCSDAIHHTIARLHPPRSPENGVGNAGGEHQTSDDDAIFFYPGISFLSGDVRYMSYHTVYTVTDRNRYICDFLQVLPIRAVTMIATKESKVS